MQFIPGFLAALLPGGGKWQATLSPQTFDYFSGRGETRRIRYESIYEVKREPGVIWDRVIVKSDRGEVQLDGLTGAVTRHLAGALRTKSSEALLSQIESNQDIVMFVVDTGPQTDTVVTAYRTSSIDKYWSA
ncbi:MAG: hypothetical protein ACT4PQ_13330 [Betaproteobacteria bacterium]